MKAHFFLSKILVLALVSQLASAEIYRYQDEHGKWRYTDKAPSDQSKIELVNVKSSESVASGKEETGEDLMEYLTKKLKPNSAIEKATIAVVKIETTYGTGSGFFVTDSGYLITNKHVVRPSSFEQIENELKQAEAAVKRSQDYLDDRQRNLDNYKKEIDDYQKRMNAASEKTREKMRGEFLYHDERYRGIKREHQEALKQLTEAQRTLADRKSGMSQSSVATVFKIIFKDGTEKQAKLVKLGNNDLDLALLKIIGGYKTPFLVEAQKEAVSQGGEVFAIGSPLGFSDFVTKGIVTRQEENRIVTDTEILPGNSGGPLVTPQGQVIGINSSVFRANGTLGSEVFGFAIPIDVARREFYRHWPEAEDSKGDLDHKTP
jgi:serine protease Do